MAPKFKYTKGEIIETGFGIVRQLLEVGAIGVFRGAQTGVFAEDDQVEQ